MRRINISDVQKFRTVVAFSFTSLDDFGIVLEKLPHQKKLENTLSFVIFFF
jgi:hypothetical protein